MSGTLGVVSGNGKFWWPAIGFAADLSYTYDTGPGYLNVLNDSPASASLAIMPSGAGELQAADLTFVGTVAATQFTGGVPGRTYTCSLLVTGVSGRIWQFFGFIAVQIISPGGYPPPPPPMPGYGTAITWVGNGA